MSFKENFYSLFNCKPRRLVHKQVRNVKYVLDFRHSKTFHISNPNSSSGLDSQPSVDESTKEEDETSEEVEDRRWNPKLSVIPGSPYVTITKDTDLQEYLGGDYIANTSSSSKDVGSTEVAPSDEKE